MNLTVELCERAVRLGLRLESRGDKLAVIPANRCPPEFADTLRQHKHEILSLLEGQAAGLAPDCAPWLHVARQVLAGEFDGADSSTVASLTIAASLPPEIRWRIGGHRILRIAKGFSFSCSIVIILRQFAIKSGTSFCAMIALSPVPVRIKSVLE
jgi:hypothetical protein